MAERLGEAAIRGGIRPEILQLITRMDIVRETASTNDDILNLPSSERHGRVILAERQTAGKGQRGRNWQSPEGNILLSLGWQFASQPRSLSNLPLAAGVCVCRALARSGLCGHGVKQPNDVLVDGAKLCGILVESRTCGAGFDTVTGVGVNIRVEEASGKRIGQPWTDLQRLLGDELPSRNVLVSAILEELVNCYSEEAGIARYLDENWSHWALTEENTASIQSA